VKSRRGEQGVGIILSPTATVAWRSAGSVLHNTFGGRVIAVRLLVKDDRQQEIGLYLVSAYAPVGVADQNYWDEFIEKVDLCVSKKLPGDILVI